MQNAPTDQAPGLYRKKIGDIVVTAIIDGVFHANYDLVKGIEPAEAERTMTEAFRPGQPVITLNCFLVHTQGKVALIDTGGGSNEMFDAGRLPAALNAAGVSPDAIDAVIMTHLHPDHTGGLATKDGAPVFRNAELVVHAQEAKFWLETANPPEEMKPFFEAAQSAVAPYRKALRTVESGEVFAGITAEPLPGHTPGHTGYAITSGRDALLIWADIVHLPALQTRHPEVYLAFDSDPEQAKAQRRRLFDKAASERMLIAGSHMDFPALAHIERSNGVYDFVPEVWRPSV